MPHELKLTLTDTELLGLRARCAEWGMSREELLIRFIRDFTGAPMNGGSDEREFAARWAERSLTYRGKPPTTEKARLRAERLQEQAYQAIRRAESEWRSQQSAVTGEASSPGIRGDRKVGIDDGDGAAVASIQAPPVLRPEPESQTIPTGSHTGHSRVAEGGRSTEVSIPPL